jgi:type IV pilus assembly protein PilW
MTWRSGRIVVSCRKRPRGFTLIELMVAMAIGLVVVGCMGSLFISNQRVYRANKALSDVQDSARVAFEFLARDIRHAGLTACGNGARVANVLRNGPSNGGTAWWANWNNVIRGFDGNDSDVAAGKGDGDRVAGKPSLQLLGADDTSYSVSSHDLSAAQFTLNEAIADPIVDDVFIACDYDHAAIFMSSSYNVRAKTLGHATTGGKNCSVGLGFPTSCGSANFYKFGANALVTRLNVADWYIGKNPEGGMSLYRFGRAGGSPDRQEMVRGVTDMQLSYHQSDLREPFVTAARITQWRNVIAVRIMLTVRGDDPQVGAIDAPIERSFTVTTTLRNRVP